MGKKEDVEGAKPEAQPPERELHIFILGDTSGSMGRKGKLESLNHAIRETIPLLQDQAREEPVDVQVRVIEFSSNASWHIGPSPEPLADFQWTPLSDANGSTNTVEALDLLSEALSLEKMPKRGVPPVCLLVSDGHYTTSEEEYNRIIEELDSMAWGSHSVRLAIGIGGSGSDYDVESMEKFVNQEEVGVLEAMNQEELIAQVRWSLTEATRAATHTRSREDKKKGEQGAVEMGSPSEEEVKVPDDVAVQPF